MRSARAQTLLNAYWAPLNFQNSALVTIAVPALLKLRFPGTDYIGAFATLASLVALISMVVPPVAGEISDRLHRAGNPRRPVILLGAIVNAAGIGWLVFADTPATFAAAVIVATLGQNVSAAAYSALIPEVVPRADWGAASGFQGVGVLLGSIAGLAVAGVAGSEGQNITLVVAALLVLVGACTLLAVPEGAFVEGDHAHVSDWRNFALAFTSRFWTNFGLALLSTFAFYFFSDVLHMTDAPAGAAWFGGMSLVGAIASSIATGYLSDQVPRKVVVAVAGIPMALAVIGFALVPNLHWIWLFAICFGLGYGAIVSTGWALAIDSVPALGSVARDLGIWGIAANLPAIVAPQAGRWILHAYPTAAQGYYALFVIAGVTFLLGSIVVMGTGRRAAAGASSPPTLPRAGGALQAFAMAIITPIYLTAYRIRGWGRLPRKRGATLLINNHQHGLDTTALIMRLSVQGPWMRPIYMAGSRRLFEPGFMEVSSPTIAYLLHFVDWSWMFRMLGVLPIENELRRRSLASFAWSVHSRHGDLPLATVFDDRALAGHAGSDRLSSVMYRQLPEKREYMSLALVREPYRSELMDVQRRQTEEDLRRIESVLHGGGTLYLTPEGRFSPDGHISRLRAVLYRMLEIPAALYLLSVSYDPFISRRLSLLYRVVAPANRDDLWSSIAAARPIVTSQLLGSWLRNRSTPFTSEEAIAGVSALLTAVPADAFVDPELRRDPRGCVRKALRTMPRLGLLRVERRAQIGDPDVYTFGSTRHDKRFPEVADILDHQANFFEETLLGIAALTRRAEERRLV